MIQHDLQSRPLEQFVQAYFEDLKRELQQLKERVEELQVKLASRLDGVSAEPYLRALSARFEAAARREAVLSGLAVAFRDFAAAPEEKLVLDALVRHGEEIAPRAVLLVRRDERWIPFRQGKLEEGDAWPDDEQAVYQRAAQNRTVITQESPALGAARLLDGKAGEGSRYCAAVPLIFGESVPAVFYADAPVHERLDVAGLEVLCQGARLAIRALRRSPPEAPAAQEKVEGAARPRPATVAEPQMAPARVVPVPQPLSETAPRADSPVDFSRNFGVAPNEFDLGEQVLREEVEAASVSMLQPTPPPPSGAAPPLTQPPAREPAAEESPIPEMAAAPLSEEEERQHADALRFARLLVSELKLYNEHVVMEGRRSQDIYARLKLDVDRSREMYDRRVPADVTLRRDYFHEEMVKLLAEGDAGLLGPGYPGSHAGGR
ncbi:MAG: hypothetical protein HYX74_09545 [Acidobacteria bacterium]|nr:hypothetical protein [Acidobacteriota bacterium]